MFEFWIIGWSKIIKHCMLESYLVFMISALESTIRPEHLRTVSLSIQ